MNVTKTAEGRWEEYWVDGSVEGAEPMRRDDRSPTAPQMIPETIRVGWSRGTVGLRKVWGVKNILIRGRNVKRDGSQGATRTFTYYGERDVPDWAQAFAVEHWPSEEATVGAIAPEASRPVVGSDYAAAEEG